MIGLCEYIIISAEVNTGTGLLHETETTVIKALEWR